MVSLLYHVTGRLNSRQDQQLSFEVLALHASDPLSSFIVVIAVATDYFMARRVNVISTGLTHPACGQGKLIIKIPTLQDTVGTPRRVIAVFGCMTVRQTLKVGVGLTGTASKYRAS